MLPSPNGPTTRSRASGLVVKWVVAIDSPRVRFPAGADLLFCSASPLLLTPGADSRLAQIYFFTPLLVPAPLIYQSMYVTVYWKEGQELFFFHRIVHTVSCPPLSPSPHD